MEREELVNNTTMRKILRKTTAVSTTLVARAAANTARVARGSVKARARASRGTVTRAANWGMPRASAPRVKGKGEFGAVIGTKAATGKAVAREQARGRGLAFSAAHWITS